MTGSRRISFTATTSNAAQTLVSAIAGFAIKIYRCRFEVFPNSTLGVAGGNNILIRSSSGYTYASHQFHIPAAAINQHQDSGWIELDSLLPDTLGSNNNLESLITPTALTAGAMLASVEYAYVRVA